MRKQPLTVTFEVEDDLTSERAADYRGAMVAAMAMYLESVQKEPGMTVDADKVFNAVLIDKMLNDCNR